MNRKAISMLLVFCLIFTLIPGTAFAKSKYKPKADVDGWVQMYPTSMSAYGKHDSEYDIYIYKKITPAVKFMPSLTKTRVCFELHVDGKVKAHYTTEETLSMDEWPEIKNIKKDPALEGVYEQYENLYKTENRVGLMEQIKESGDDLVLSKQNLEHFINKNLEEKDLDTELDFSQDTNPFEMIKEEIRANSGPEFDHFIDSAEQTYVILNEVEKIDDSKTFASLFKNIKSFFDKMITGIIVATLANIWDYAQDVKEAKDFALHMGSYIFGEMFAGANLFTEAMQSGYNASVDKDEKLSPFYNDIDESYDFIVNRILELSKAKK